MKLSRKIDPTRKQPTSFSLDVLVLNSRTDGFERTNYFFQKVGILRQGCEVERNVYECCPLASIGTRDPQEPNNRFHGGGI